MSTTITTATTTSEQQHDNATTTTTTKTTSKMTTKTTFNDDDDDGMMIDINVDDVEDSTTQTTLKVIKDEISMYENPTKSCIARIHTDLKSLFREPLEGIFVVQDSKRVNRCHAIIIGPLETPYEHGMFYFILDFPNDYPLNSPKVELLTTGGGSVRFNPNLYKDGKVCLSILGTWNGPEWSPVQNIGSILLSIQSLLNERPYHNEPGYEQINKYGQQPKNYNHIIRHETIRIAVLDMVDRALTTQTRQQEQQEQDSNNNKHNSIPSQLQSLIRDTFLILVDCCLQTCDEYKFLDGRKFNDPYHFNVGVFKFGLLQQRLLELHDQMLLLDEDNDSEDK